MATSARVPGRVAAREPETRRAKVKRLGDERGKAFIEPCVVEEVPSSGAVSVQPAYPASKEHYDRPRCYAHLRVPEEKTGTDCRSQLC